MTETDTAMAWVDDVLTTPIRGTSLYDVLVGGNVRLEDIYTSLATELRRNPMDFDGLAYAFLTHIPAGSPLRGRVLRAIHPDLSGAASDRDACQLLGKFFSSRLSAMSYMSPFGSLIHGLLDRFTPYPPFDGSLEKLRQRRAADAAMLLVTPIAVYFYWFTEGLLPSIGFVGWMLALRKIRRTLGDEVGQIAALSIYTFILTVGLSIAAIIQLSRV